MNNLHKITNIPEPFLVLADMFPRVTYYWRGGWMYLKDGSEVNRGILDDPMKRRKGKVGIPSNIRV